jgi:hypothetical protein
MRLFASLARSERASALSESDQALERAQGFPGSELAVMFM